MMNNIMDFVTENFFTELDNTFNNNNNVRV